MGAALGVPPAPVGGHGVAAVTSRLLLVAGGTVDLGHVELKGWFR